MSAQHIRIESGRDARQPKDFPAPAWKDILYRTKDEVSKDNLSIVAGGVAFYMLLAIFPGIGAMVAIYALVADPAQIQQQLSALCRRRPCRFSRISSPGWPPAKAGP